MTFGKKLETLRNEKNLSQERLGEMLNVSRITIYKWESDQNKPEIDKLTKLSDIFGVSLDYLLKDNDIDNNIDTQVDETDTKDNNNAVIVDNTNIDNNNINITKDELSEIVNTAVQNSRVPVAICENCKKNLYNPNEFVTIVKKGRLRGKGTHYPDTQVTLCLECNKKAEIKNANNDKKKLSNNLKKCWAAFIITMIIVLPIAIFAIYANVNTEAIGLVVGFNIFLVLCGPMLAFDMFTFEDNFAQETLETIGGWTCVKFPGIIFSADLDGIKFLIVMKIIFFIIGFIIGLAGLILSTLLCMVLAPFSFISSLIKFHKQKLEYNKELDKLNSEFNNMVKKSA